MRIVTGQLVRYDALGCEEPSVQFCSLVPGWSATRTKLKLIPQPPATSQLAQMAAWEVADNDPYQAPFLTIRCHRVDEDHLFANEALQGTLLPRVFRIE
jgi:hypothetical protein